MRIAVVTVSDSCTAGKRKDESGPKLVELLKTSQKLKNVSVIGDSPILVADDLEKIKDVLLDQVDRRTNVVITTGGTGFAKRDITPEATLQVIQRRCTGLEVAIHQRSLMATPMAALSRAIAGITEDTLIVNMPGSVKAVAECWQVLEPILNHAFDLINNCDDGSQHEMMKSN